MGITRNQTYGNIVNHLPCTVYQSENQVARERSVYSRFTNHDSLSYPNPATNQLNIDFDERPNENITVLIFDLNAKEVMRKTFGADDNTNKLDISALSNGIYQICIRSNSGILYSDRINISK